MKKIPNLGTVKRAFKTVAKALSPRGNIRREKEGAEETFNRSVKQTSSSSNSSSEHKKIASPRKGDASNVANSQTISTASYPKLAARPVNSSQSSSSTGGGNKPEFSPHIQIRKESLPPQEQHREMIKCLSEIRSKYKNLNRDDLVRTFSWTMRQHSHIKISQAELDGFVDINKVGDELGEFQPVKLKSNYLSHEHDFVNTVDREIFYDGFSSLSQQHSLKTLVQKVPKEIIKFFDAEIVEKSGIQFRGRGQKTRDDIHAEISAFGMAVRWRNIHPEDWTKLSKVLQEDPEFNAWKARKESGSSMENGRGEQPQIQSAPVSPREPRDSEMSTGFCEDFAQVLAAHSKLRGRNGGPYVPGERGRSHLKEFVSKEKNRKDALSGWSDLEKKAFRKLDAALQDESSDFKPKHWLDFREVIEKNKTVQRHLTSSRRASQTIVAEPLKFENPGITYRLNPSAYGVPEFLLESFKWHSKKWDDFDTV
jgi:hypothetical protein